MDADEAGPLSSTWDKESRRKLMKYGINIDPTPATFDLSAEELSSAFVHKEEFAQLLARTGVCISVFFVCILIACMSLCTCVYMCVGGIDGLAHKLKTDIRNGLSDEETLDNFAERRKHYGDNVYPEKPRKMWIELWWDAMQDTTIIILCISALVSLVLGLAVPLEEESDEWTDGLAILVAVLLVTCVTATNEYQQEGQFRDLNKVKDDKYVCLRVSFFKIIISPQRRQGRPRWPHPGRQDL